MFQKVLPYHMAGDYLNIEFQAEDKIQPYKIHQLLVEYAQVKAG
jgi:hypothetical protein